MKREKEKIIIRPTATQTTTTTPTRFQNLFYVIPKDNVYKFRSNVTFSFSTAGYDPRFIITLNGVITNSADVFVCQNPAASVLALGVPSFEYKQFLKKGTIIEVKVYHSSGGGTCSNPSSLEVEEC